MFNRVESASDGRSDGALHVQKNELNECAAIYCRASRTDEEYCASVRRAVISGPQYNAEDASLIKISTVFGPIPSNSDKRFSNS
jgi:hypothetical protein